MNNAGIIRRVDDLGRIVIPREIRSKFGIRDGTPMEIITSNDGIMLKKYYFENSLSDRVNDLIENVDDMCVDLGPEKAMDIKRYLQNVQDLLHQVE